MEIQLSRWNGLDLIKQFNPATCMCLSQARTWISNIICCCLFYVQWEVIVRFVDIGEIANHPCLNFRFIASFT